MRRLMCVALLGTVACTTVPTVESVPTEPEPAPVLALDEHEAGPPGIQGWIPGVFADLWETFDARLGVDYGLGAHVKFTDLARIGIFDYSDFTLIGVDKGIFHGQWNYPDMKAWTKNGAWDLGVMVGVGFGGEAHLRTWEVLDFFSSVVGLGYWSLNND